MPKSLHFIITVILLVVCFSGNADNIPDISHKVITNQKFNLKNLYAKGHVGTMAYDPNAAIAACPDIYIWPNAPDLPSPPTPDCGPAIAGQVSSQMAYSCNVKSHIMGMQLARSVVGIYEEDRNQNYSLTCTGVIIGKRWILTAKHCLNWDKKYTTNNVIIPWQSDLDGVPRYININQHLEIGKIEKVRNAYKYDDNLDMTILELEDDLADITVDGIPHWLQSIQIAPENANTLPNNHKLWQAGYGYDENQQINGKLSYKDIYSTDRNWSSYLITTLGSQEEYYKGELSAWSVAGVGDSGGPVLEYDPSTQKFSLVGIHFAGGCSDWTGYFAPIDDSVTLSVKVNYPVTKNIINSIINGTYPQHKMQCMSAYEDGCAMDNLYVVNSGSNNISINQFDSKRGLLQNLSIAPTGIKPIKIIFDDKGWYAYVLNQGTGHGSISMFETTSKRLVPLAPSHYIQTAGDGTPVDMAYFNDHIYVINQDSNSIQIFKQNKDNGSLNEVASIKTPQFNNLNSIYFLSKNFNEEGTNYKGYAYVLCYKGILIYKVDEAGNLHYISTLSIGNSSKIKFTSDRNKAYVIFKEKNDVVEFRRTSNGQLFRLNTNQVIDIPNDISVADDASHIYLSFNNRNNLAAYQVTPFGLQSYNSDLPNPTALIRDATNKYLFVTSFDSASVFVCLASVQDTNLQCLYRFDSKGYNPNQIATLDTLQ